MSASVARLAGITRRFGAVTALDRADLEIRAAEVHGVLGANGAGKSTLLGILGGMLRPDEGTIEIDGAPVRLRTPRDAWSHGVALVHQHFTLVPALPILDNLALGLRLKGGLRLDREGVRSRAREMMERTGLSVPLDDVVERLGVGDRQRAEILKALLREPRVLVLDEPTAVLAPAEIEGLFGILRGLAADGRAVVLVAHKLDEVLGVADRVTVLRDGRSVLSSPVGDTSETALVRAMVGGGDAGPATLGLEVGARAVVEGGTEAKAGAAGTVESAPASVGAARAAPVARLVDVSTPATPGSPALRAVTLEVQRGEIVGITGVEGNGQHRLALVLSGRESPKTGTVELPAGVGYIPQDRSTEGVVADFDLAENVALALHREDAYVDGPWLRWKALVARADELRSEYGIVAPGTETLAGALSGGNQQRVVVARELAVARDLVVAENPTRGLDVTAAAFVHRALGRLSASGADGPAVVLLSTDLDEVLALADRLFVMTGGHLKPVAEGDRSREGVGRLMLRSERDG